MYNRHYEKFADGRVKDIEDEIPFAVPEGWAWCRLPNLCKIPITDGTHQTPTYSDKENGIPFLSSKDVTSRKIDWNKIKYITKELHEELQKRIQPCRNDILLAKNGTTGVAALVDTDKIFDIYVTLAVLRPAEVVHPNYLHYVINSPFCKKQFNGHLTGIGVPNLHLNDICKTIIPLPPLSEQQRIVAKIETIFAQIDLLEQNKADLQTAVKQAKSKILDLAIHGKLVPQDSADEPASVMLERLRAEKEAKIAAGEIKRGKHDSYIYRNPTDNCYYEKFDDGTEIAIEIDSIIPEAWVWCYFSDIADVINGKNQSKVKDDAGKYPIYGSGGIIGYANDYICPKNCTIIGRKGSINNPIFTEEKSWNVDTAFGLVPSSIILPRYLFYFCKSFDFTSLDSSTTLPSLTKTNIQHILFLLPPLAAQQRIVDKVDELFSQLDKIALNIV